MYPRFNSSSGFLNKTHLHTKRLSWSTIAPLCLLFAFAALSFPMMYPGFDIWVHLVSINSDGAIWSTPWHTPWREIFNWLAITNPFTQAKIIHSTQVLFTGGLLWLASRWILTLTFAGLNIKRHLINSASWLAVLIWILMHGTVSTAVNSNEPVWYAWLIWYSVNYQITLPMYVFATATFLFGCFGHKIDCEALPSWLYFSASALATIAIAILHAAELPYALYSLLIIGVLWFKWQWKWHYVAGLIFFLCLLAFGLTNSYRLPAGIEVFQQQGLSGFIHSIATSGQQLVQGMNRGNASWNYWYSLNLALALGIYCWMFFFAHGAKRGLNLRMVGFLIISVLPAAMLHWSWTAGILGMITYPALASRFSFSSFLFLALPVALLAIAANKPQLINTRRMSTITGVVIGTILLLSYQTEANKVSYRYAKSLLLSLSPERMSFGLTPSQEAWLNNVYSSLVSTPPSEPLCTDMHTAYYLYFVKNYDQVTLPDRVNWNIDPTKRSSEDSCPFPNDGGDISKLGLGSPPW